MKAILKKFKVENFRSIENSGWIETENVGCLVGTNESGKTNILLALWKLNPANSEPIIPLIDYPRKKYHNYSLTKGEEIFITAIFEFSQEISKELSVASGWNQMLVSGVEVSRQFNGKYVFSFAKNKLESFPSKEIELIFREILTDLDNSDLKEKEAEATFNDLKNKFEELKSSYGEEKDLDRNDITNIRKEVFDFIDNNYKRKLNINAFVKEKCFDILDRIIAAFELNGLEFTEKCRKIVQSNLPTFVYYSDYGNLDSEIFLPHVIDNFERSDLGEKERAKVRSLKVLFEFVNLSPKQILELGQEAMPVKVITKNYQGSVESEEIQEPEEKNIKKESEHKKEREILLQSASSTLTDDFKNWWKQGNYKFRFQADGNHFRIWVSDEKRTEEIELEGRSRGLQWFFSFFLVFLVESKDTHSNCILLLDEPGISLHPLAQFDLTAFFNSLSKENQLIYTTHSPFLVNPNNLSGVYAMYIGDKGESIVSPDLRANKKIAEKSIYPVHAAIGITVSDTLLIGCQPVLVEGVSDQIYLQLIKTYVLSQGKYRNNRELVFIPTGGVKGMSPVIKILMGRENDLPYVLLDSDKNGKLMCDQLVKGLYKMDNDKILSVDTFLKQGEFEIEDLMPSGELARIFSKQYRRTVSDDEFDDIFDEKVPLVKQMEKYAVDNGYDLEDGWKVELAKEFQRNFERIVIKTPEQLKSSWINLIGSLTTNNA